MHGGLATPMPCGAGSTDGTYPHGIRLCQAYVDQKLLDKHVDIQVGLIEDSFQFANTDAGGSPSSGTLGPDASIPALLGTTGVGLAAPAVNPIVDLGHYHEGLGIQRAAFLQGTIYESGWPTRTATASTIPVQACCSPTRTVGYRQSSAPGKLNTWVRVDVLANTSEYMADKGGKDRADTLMMPGDQQLTQVDRVRPRRGLYAGASGMWATPSTNAYDNDYDHEGRIYDVGLFRSRPYDQIAFVASETGVGSDYGTTSRAKGYGTKPNIYNLTLCYAYPVAPGVFFCGGLTDAVHPSPTYAGDRAIRCCSAAC